jgi:hypothetical protein
MNAYLFSNYRQFKLDFLQHQKVDVWLNYIVYRHGINVWHKVCVGPVLQHRQHIHSMMIHIRPQYLVLMINWKHFSRNQLSLLIQPLDLLEQLWLLCMKATEEDDLADALYALLEDVRTGRCQPQVGQQYDVR